MKIRSRTVRKPTIWCVLLISVKIQISLNLTQMGSEPLLSTLKRFKSLGMQRVENDSFDHIEGRMPKLI